MEFIFAASGPLYKLKQFETQMEAASWSIPYVDASGRLLQQSGGGLIEPIQLYRVICPKATGPLFARTLRWRTPSTAKEQVGGFSILALRKLMGLKDYNPEDPGALDERGPKLPVNTENIQIVPIGYKDDAEGIIGTTGTYQEKL